MLRNSALRSAFFTRVRFVRLLSKMLARLDLLVSTHFTVNTIFITKTARFSIHAQRAIHLKVNNIKGIKL